LIVVINAGGSGTRLWPLSVPEYPKHLLQITGDTSLMQEAYQRAKQLTDSIYIVTEAGHAHHVKDQLPELSDEAFIIEPARRGTAGCIVAGLHHIQSRHPHDEPIAFLQADHVIRDTEGFVHSFTLAAEASKKYNKVTLIGINPTAPATGFGYIHKGSAVETEDSLYEVAGFKEKPEQSIAEEYLKSGEYVWNGGYFVGSVNTFAHALEQYSPKWFEYYQDLVATESDDDYKKAYLALESDAIDYALLELDPELLVVPADFDWMDVGSFSDVHSAVDTDDDGNHVKSGKSVMVDAEDNLIINQESGKPVGVIGLSGIVVINTKNGLLIAHKDHDQKVKDVVNQLKDQAND